MDADPAQQIARLESHIAHLERQYDELNQVVIEQGRELARLRLQVQRVASSVEGMELDRVKSTQRKPPHSVI